MKTIDWKEGTYFSVAIWGYRSWWVVVNDIDNETCDCLFLKGTDPRILSNGGMFNGFRKSYYEYGGREEKEPIKFKCNNLLLRIFKGMKKEYKQIKNKQNGQKKRSSSKRNRT